MATCERFGCLPSQLMAEPGELARLLRIEQLGRREEAGEQGVGEHG